MAREVRFVAEFIVPASWLKGQLIQFPLIYWEFINCCHCGDDNIQSWKRV